MVLGFGILLLLGLAFILGGLLFAQKNKPIASDRSLLQHPDITFRSVHTRARLNIVTGQILALVGAVAILFGVYHLLTSVPHPP